jgi:hypothetical protein
VSPLGAWRVEPHSKGDTTVSYKNFASSMLSCGDLLAGLEQNREELPFLAEATDRLAAGVTELRDLESRKQQLQSELAMATHRRQELEVASVAVHRRLVRILQGHFTLYSDRLREFGLRPRTKSARKTATPVPTPPKPTPVSPVAADVQSEVQS